jgi:uncharacterized protein with FMN-binding domain
MRRAPFVITATAAGVVALLSFHPRTAQTVGVAGATGGIASAVEPTRYGPVQLRVLVRGGRLVDVTALQLPGDEPRSVAINQFAAPRLRAEALQAQSASVTAISGATITSEAYAAALQSALGKAGLS